MKRFSIFCAALFAAVTSFAAVNYELNGGVTNAEGWTSKSDMWETFKVDAGVTTLAALDVLQAAGDASLSTICTPLLDPNVTAIMGMERWDWLEAYIMNYQNSQTANGATALVEGTSSAGWRYAIAAFFLETQRTGWPVSADFTFAGQLEAFMPSWKHAFANPTEPTAAFVLNAPYKEGFSFEGWYAAADFSGTKVTKVDSTSTGTLYAKWVDYIPTIAEVKALDNDADAKTIGVVNFISGKNVYIQDVTGGILLYTSAEPTCKVGDKIVVKGKKVLYGGAPEIKGAEIESAEAAALPRVKAFENLSALVKDTTFNFFATRVSVPGLRIAAYNDYNNPFVTDGKDTVECYKMSLDPVKFPVGVKVSVNAVAGWFNGFQFVGDAAGIELVIIGKKENYTYPERSNGRYTLKNNWVISMMEDNYVANKPGSNDYVRGMAAQDGIMYFINRETQSIVRVDAATAEMLEPIKITGDHVFQVKAGVDSLGNDVWAGGPTLAYNDIKFDQEGHCLIGGCVEAKTKCQPFQIYMVDLETGEAKELINDVLWENPGLDSIQIRFDAFGVAGDVTKNGVVMAADANEGNWLVYRWLIKDGVAGEGEQVAILLDPNTDESLYINANGFYTAPQIFPQDKEGSLFYVDGFNTLPMLFYGEPETGAKLVDDFINVPTGVDVTNNEGEVLSMNTGHNGLIEFQVGDEYFLLMAASNTAKTPPSAFALYKFADADRAFSGMEPLWYFPHNGLGAATNGCRTAVPSVDVVSDTQAVLYIYANNNGYATYTLTIDPTKSAVEDVEAVEVGTKKVLENGQVFIIKNGVKYNTLGAEVK